MPSSSAIAASKSLMVGSIVWSVLGPRSIGRNTAAGIIDAVAAVPDDLAIQLAAVQRYAHAIAGGDAGCVANDGGLALVPADCVPATEHRERTETVEARRGAAQPSIRAVAAAMH